MPGRRREPHLRQDLLDGLWRGFVIQMFCIVSVDWSRGEGKVGAGRGREGWRREERRGEERRREGRRGEERKLR